MSVGGGDRRAMVVQGISQDDKLGRTGSVPAHGQPQNVSQVWRVGPCRVSVEVVHGEERLWIAGQPAELLRWLLGLGASYEEAVRVAGAGSVPVGFAVQFTPALDRLLVDLVDVIADVRRATGMVQLELEGLEEEDGG